MRIGARLLRALAATLLMAVAAPAATMQWPDLLTRPRPKADAVIAYGADPLQHVDLWLPKGAGPFPLVVMVHGGCWQTEIARADIMDWIAADLRTRGIAVWNIDYRGVDRPGGGYPGTFLDVAAAADAVQANAAKYRLRRDRVVVVGHSAGGHLGLWLAARDALPLDSALRTGDPLPIAAAFSLGGLPDLEAASTPPGATCGTEVVPKLVGAPTTTHADVYADTSPARLPQPHIPITLINGSADRIAPPAFAQAYTARVDAPRMRRVEIAGEGHVELIAPGSKAWTETARLIEAAAR